MAKNVKNSISNNDANDQNGLKTSEEVIVKPKKKRHIWWRILLAVFIVIAIPVGLAYGLLYDNKTKDISNIDKNFNTQKFGSNLVIDGFSYTKTEKKFSIRMGENQLNSLLYTASQKLPDVAKQFIPKVYCDIQTDKNQYDFYLDAVVPMFQTRACLSTKLTDHQDYFEFKIIDIKAGRIGGLDWAFKKFVPKSTVDDIFSNTGLSIKFDLENMSLTYNKDDMLKDMTKMMGGVSESDNLFVTLFEQLNELDLIHVVSGVGELDKYLALDVDLESLTTNSKYVRSNTTALHDKIKGIMGDAIADMMEDENAIDSTAASSIVQHYIDDLEVMKYAKDNYDADYLQDCASTKSEDGGPFTVNLEKPVELDPTSWYVTGTTEITNDQIDNFIASTGIIGKTTGFYDKESNKFAYITINDMYANIYNGNIDFVITLDMNGLDTFIILPTKAAAVTGNVNYKLDLEIENLKLGENEITTDKLSAKLMDEYLKPVLNSENGLIQISDDNKKLTLNLKDSFDAGMKNYSLQAYSNVTKFVIAATGIGKDDDAAKITVEFEAHSNI